jgi:flagellar motor switch protein FliM
MADSTPLLSQEELAALAEGVSNGSIDVDSGFNTDAPVRKHDLASEDSSLGVNVGSLDMINERFIRLFRLGMLEVLRTSPRMNPGRAQIVRFGDYLKDLKAPLSVNIIRMAPLRGYAMVVIEPGVIFSSLDSFFGGFGKGVAQLPPGRLFTPTESRIIKIILQLVFRSYKEAWAPVTPIEFEHVSSEINPQFAQIADENDLVVLNRFESDSQAQPNGFVDMVIPYMALKPVRDLLRSRVQTGDGDEESDKVWRKQLTNAVHDARLEMQILLGSLIQSAQDMQNMKEGDVLFFKKPEHARVVIRDMPVFDVEIGTLGSQVAVKIVKSIQLPDSGNKQG